jgi:hypothetical protein
MYCSVIVRHLRVNCPRTDRRVQIWSSSSASPLDSTEPHPETHRPFGHHLHNEYIDRLPISVVSLTEFMASPCQEFNRVQKGRTETKALENRGGKQESSVRDNIKKLEHADLPFYRDLHVARKPGTRWSDSRLQQSESLARCQIGDGAHP